MVKNRTVEKMLRNSVRLRELFNPEVFEHTPKLKVEDVPLTAVQVLSDIGYSKSEARRMVSSGMVKVENSLGEKVAITDRIEDYLFTVVENGEIGATIMWIGKKKPVLIYC